MSSYSTDAYGWELSEPAAMVTSAARDLRELVTPAQLARLAAARRSGTDVEALCGRLRPRPVRTHARRCLGAPGCARFDAAREELAELEAYS